MSSEANSPAAPPSQIAWVKGGHADFVTVVDDVVTLRSTIPSPPGSRIDARLEREPAVDVRVKIHGSKLESDGTFTLKGRLIDANRELRTRLADLAKETASGSSGTPA